MKQVLRIILAIILGFIIYGSYINTTTPGEGEKFIGIGVLIFAFILMPFFIYHRYKNKDLRSYSLFQEPDEDDDKDETEPQS